MSSFTGLREVIEAEGLFCALYVDRAGHYRRTPEAGGKVDRDNPTQVHRALAQLGIEHIPAYSPEARGRSERVFRTLQDRLPKELRLAGIATVEAAIRTKKAPANFAAVKHMALNALRKAPGKDSLQSKRFLAAWDEDYLAKALSAL